jgi:N-acetylmuramoyl-L-alanine amidase
MLSLHRVHKILFVNFLIIILFISLVSPAWSFVAADRITITRDDGSRVELPVYRFKDTMMLSIQDQAVIKFIESYGARVTYLAPLETIVIGFRGGRDFRMKISERKAQLGNKPVTLTETPLLIGGKPHIPLEALEKALGFKIVFNHMLKTYEFQPVVTSISLTGESGKYKLTISCSSPVEYRTTLLEDPSRFAIDIQNAAFDPDLVESDLYIPGTGAVFIFQDTVEPQQVRVTIPLDSGARVVLPEERADKATIEAEIITENIVDLSQVLGSQRITDLREQQSFDRVTFRILTTGPVQYKWRRVFTPENQYIVDIPNTVYTAPTYFKTFDVGYLKSIKVEQYMLHPEPVVRVTVDLHVPSVINIGTDPRYSEINMEILARTLNPRRADVAREGTGVVDTPAAPVASQKGIVITIDPGHGGGDPGAVNRILGLREKDVTLDISLRLAQLLRQAGWKVILTRTTDRDVTYARSPDILELSSRVQAANRSNSQLFVSIHIDASTDPAANGMSVFYGKDNSIALARYINYHLAIANGRRNRGIFRGPFHVINNANMPAVLVECAFISNYAEAVLLSDPAFRQRCAEGIYRGLIAYAKAARLSGVQAVTSSTPSKEELEMDKHIREKLQEVRRRIETSEPIGDDAYRER